MKTFRFVGGGKSVIGDRELDRFGASIELDAAQAQNALEGGAVVIPDSRFQPLGFTAHELRTFAYPGGFPEPTAEFVAKRAQAQAIALELLAEPASVNGYFVEVITERFPEQVKE